MTTMRHKHNNHPDFLPSLCNFHRYYTAVKNNPYVWHLSGVTTQHRFHRWSTYWCIRLTEENSRKIWSRVRSHRLRNTAAHRTVGTRGNWSSGLWFEKTLFELRKAFRNLKTPFVQRVPRACKRVRCRVDDKVEMKVVDEKGKELFHQNREVCSLSKWFLCSVWKFFLSFFERIK